MTEIILIFSKQNEQLRKKEAEKSRMQKELKKKQELEKAKLEEEKKKVSSVVTYILFKNIITNNVTNPYY